MFTGQYKLFLRSTYVVYIRRLLNEVVVRMQFIIQWREYITYLMAPL